MIKILTLEDYYEAQKSLEVDPLVTAWDNEESLIQMPIRLRVEIQDSLFQAASHTAALQKFYRWCWDNKPHRCEETGTPLYIYRSVHISHIMSRGAHAEKSFDPRNTNILIPTAHSQWETGERSIMRIYWRNQKTIELLRKEYNSLQPKKIE